VKKKGSTDQETNTFGSPTTSASASGLTPLDIQNKEFRVSRMGGYRMRDVDEFLDQITDSLSALISENARLREAGNAGGAGVGSGGEVEDARREAERILAEARERAAEIGSGAADLRQVTSADDVAAVQAFLRKERDFLRSLGSLVQGHAEEMKGMARDARPPSNRASASTGEETGEPASGGPEPEATAAMSQEELESDDPEPIRVAEPEPAASRHAEEAKREGSLRDLFWGEEG
jgi:DivIVA domain-containing protein